ncbi:MAG: 6-phosphofructokinase [Legionellales bacterium RIFCSPHIGHO2_12_FULL_42_9]|nr:MAG: 6-phosphofructokinase [Legionellales bacterium RIFCSPHIGHO2_12_FULL_42_9]
MLIKNALYAQSGGVTAVINASACAVMQTARHNPTRIKKVFAAKNGILGVLNQQLIDTSCESDQDIAKLMHTPAGAFGSCRYKLQKNDVNCTKLLDIFEQYQIGYFFYNGGGDSMDTANIIANLSFRRGHPITCIGIPKTVDNDLPFTDTCPGFGSVAKYVAISTKEAGFDVESMAESSTKVFILEVMGRHAGWIAAASCLANDDPTLPPHIILLPEVPFIENTFLLKVEQIVKQCGYCVIVVSEGIRDQQGKFLSESGLKDAFGHSQLGGVAPIIAQLIKHNLNYKYHWAVADYLQRAARHIASQVDLDQAYAVGKAAVELALAGHNAVMPIIKRINDMPYQWEIDTVKLDEVANKERQVPKEFIDIDGFHVTQACRRYLSPLIQGEAYPPYKNGLPDYVHLKNQMTPELFN